MATPAFDPTQQPAATTTPTSYGTSAPSIPQGLGWTIAPFEHYLGRDPTAAEIASIRKLHMNYDMLVEHLRNQPSHVKGLTNGALEDYHKVATPAFFKWTGREATDADIQQLVNNGINTPDAIEKYLTNRPDVIAAHPGAPVGLGDEQWQQHKAAINSQYQANLGKDATDQEARDALTQAASPFRKAPAEQLGLSTGVKPASSGLNQGALMSEAQIAPNARNSAI